MDARLTGKIIAEKRKEKGLNQIQLGEKLNVSNRTVSKWEKGDGFPDITLLPEISRQLDITIDELLTGEKPEGGTIIFENKEDVKKKLMHEFKLLFIFALFLSMFSALLGGITEVYCIWAFPILFYTHWEIMFAAVSLFAIAAGILLFVVGIYRLRLEFSKSEIIKSVKNKTLVLFAVSAVFPLSFIARILDLAIGGMNSLVFIIIILLILIGSAAVLYKRIK